jgi:phosphoribosylformylglycinamidine (FGAM) synthase-like enzyme
VGLGGLAASVSKMCFKNSVGCSVNFVEKEQLFSENLSIIVEVKKKNSMDFEKTLKEKGVSFDNIGKTNNTKKIVFDGYINTEISLTKNVWKNSLRERLQQ